MIDFECIVDAVCGNVSNQMLFFVDFRFNVLKKKKKKLPSILASVNKMFSFAFPITYLENRYSHPLMCLIADDLTGDVQGDCANAAKIHLKSH